MKFAGDTIKRGRHLFFQQRHVRNRRHAHYRQAAPACRRWLDKRRCAPRMIASAKSSSHRWRHADDANALPSSLQIPCGSIMQSAYSGCARMSSSCGNIPRQSSSRGMSARYIALKLPLLAASRFVVTHIDRAGNLVHRRARRCRITGLRRDIALSTGHGTPSCFIGNILLTTDAAEPSLLNAPPRLYIMMPTHDDKLMTRAM